MNDPKRLIDQCESGLERALLREGRRSTHDEARRLRVLGAVGVGAAVTAGTKTGWALAATWQKLLLGGVAVCSGVGGGVLAVQSYRATHPAIVVHSAETQATSANAQLASPDVAEPEQAGAGAEALPNPRVLNARAAAGASAVVESAVSPSKSGTGAGIGSGVGASVGARPVSGERRGPERSSLREEVAVLDRARAAARAGRNVEALTLVDSYGHDFPQGSLRLEAEVVRVQVLAAAGRRSEASVRAKKLLAQSPNSVVASRLRGYILE